MDHPPLNPNHIAQALTAIHSPGATPQQIKTANDFLNQHESHPLLSTTLLSIYCETTSPQLQMSSLLLLTNVIKRNWNTKRATTARPALTPQVKEELRAAVLRAYSLHEMRHYKHFNTLLAYLARMDFPAGYIGLYEFIGNWLRQLGDAVSNGLTQLLRNDRVLVVLSTVKAVLKEYNLKKMAHSNEIFSKYIASLIQIAASLSQTMLPQVQRLVSEGTPQAPMGMECLRKVDKVVLYSLGSMTVLYQYQQETQGLIRAYVGRVEEFSAVLQALATKGAVDTPLWQQVEKYLIGVLQQIGRLQNYFPFAFAPFLREYLVLILRLLVQNVSRPYHYQSDKLLSAIITANIKPLTCFAYYMSESDFRGSVYSRQKAQFDNIALQIHCHSVFKQVYSTQTVVQLVQTIVCQIMTAPHVLKDHKEFSDQLVLEDVEVAVVEQMADPSVYQNCVSLLKQIVKCFKQETRPVIGALIDQAKQIRIGPNTDPRNRQVFLNILQVILFLPHIYSEQALPIDQVCGVISATYQSGLYGHLSRLIRKYYAHLPSQTARSCFQLLAKVVATPAGGHITPQVIYQAALGLKTLMGGLESDNIPVQVVAGCINNIVTLVGLPQVVACPTLMWPIINLLIRLVKNLNDIDKQLVGEAAGLIVRGLAPLIASEKNEELLVNALVQLIAMLFYCCFKPLKQQFLLRSRPGTLSEKVQATGSGAVLFQAGFLLLQRNMHNKALENNCNLQCFWLSLMRSYPSLYEQQAYNFDLARVNTQLVAYFQAESKDLLQDDPVIFLQILEEYFITELLDISPQEIVQLITSTVNNEQAGSQRRLRISMAAVSLYTSYSLLRTPLPPLTELFFRQQLDLQNRISPQANALRTAILLLLGQRVLFQGAGEIYRAFSQWTGGDVGRWLLPYLWNMHFVTNKFAFKLNAAVLLKAITDLGPSAFAQLMKTQYQNQYAIDEFLKIITIELEPLNLDFLINSYYNITRTLLPHEIVPEFEVSVYRKVRLQVGDPLLMNVASMDLKDELRKQLNAVMQALDWSSADIQQRVGETAALKFCDYLGWERVIK